MTSNEKNTSALIHLSTLSQYIIPFGGFIFPIIIWSSKKNDSEFIDANGKQALNFQLSMFLYTLLLLLVSIPTLIYLAIKNVSFSANHFDSGNFKIEDLSNENFTTFIIIAAIAFGLFIFSKISEFILVIIAGVKASNGESYKYPLTINFFK
ncbi:MAG: DUF4870 domain-containing protein [Flavobacterium sp.]|uniref:DUF4870 domain-containing protein n=1 Tax=Flavobacterium sp. TaxID=239 RepID=UPI0022CB7600|nr:DUF4870 domain-containing protein [Flavobacterium sp.]MCZ8198663.1 DUF4870 domain-containing protein [Flavobacterium sp.]